MTFRIDTPSHEWADNNTLVGFSEKRGEGYHFYGTESNSYPAGVPLQAIEDRLLGWEAVEVPLSYNHPNIEGMTITDESKKLLVASDTGDLLGIHGTTRPTRQYRDALIDQVKDLLDVPELHVGSVGFLNNRKVMWINIEMEETLEVGGTGIEFRPFFLAATSHDASVSWTFRSLNELVVCGNMVRGLLRKGDLTHRVKATVNSELDIKVARENLGILHANSEKFMADIKALTERTVTEKQWVAFRDALAPMPKEDDNKRGITRAEGKRDILDELYHNDPMVSPWAGTAFGLFQADSTFQHHHTGTRGSNTRAERNLERTVKKGVGSLDQMDQSTLDIMDRVLTTV